MREWIVVAYSAVKGTRTEKSLFNWGFVRCPPAHAVQMYKQSRGSSLRVVMGTNKYDLNFPAGHDLGNAVLKHIMSESQWTRMFGDPRTGTGPGRPLGRARGKWFACAAPPLATRPHAEKVRLHARSRPDAAATPAWHRNRWPLPAASPRRTAVICSDARRGGVREPLLGYNMPLRPTGFTGDPAPRPLGEFCASGEKSRARARQGVVTKCV